MEKKIAWVVERTYDIYIDWLQQRESQVLSIILPFDDPNFYQIFIIIDEEPFTKFRNIGISDEIILHKYYTSYLPDFLGSAIHRKKTIKWKKSEPSKIRGEFADLGGERSWTEARAKIRPEVIFCKPQKTLRVRFL